MAKDLPYFKFFCSEWNDGDITLEDYNTQGLFINLCSYYWSNECDVTLAKSQKKFKDADSKMFQTLIDSELIHINEGVLSIKFLDEQKEERVSKSLTNSKNGKKGGRPRKPIESEDKPNALISLSESYAKQKAIREEEIRRELISFDKFWKYYDKKVNKPKSLSLFIKLTDKELDAMRIHLPKYLESTPDKQFRKSPDSYLRNKCWNDEIINRKQPKQMERL